MIIATLFPGRYLQGDGAFSRLGGERARFGENEENRGTEPLFSQGSGNI